MGGAAITLAIWMMTDIEWGKDFGANVAGATIGGIISVGLALGMFDYQRRSDQTKADEQAAAQRRDAILQSLRYIRAIHSCVAAASGLTINKADSVVSNLSEASNDTARSLSFAGTDYPLRDAMRRASTIGLDAAGRIGFAANNSGLQDANTPILAVEAFVADALTQLDVIINDYKDLRKNPPEF